MIRAKWEYQAIRLDVRGAAKARVDLDAAHGELNRLGADGGELVSAVSGSESGAVLCVFKRPV